MSLPTLLSLFLLPHSLLAISCNFEIDICEWEQNMTIGLTWIRDNGKGPNLTNHGPMYDHTINGKGHYLFIDTSPTNVSDPRAQLTSVLQTVTSANQCLSFWYHMYGPQIGNLSLMVQQQDQAAELLWTRTGTHGNQWRHAFHTIPPQNKEFKLIFEATRRGSAGDIAIDDVALVEGACGVQGMCSFEANVCQFTSTGTQMWERQIGDPGTSSNRPVIDHTTETTEGHYMLADTSEGVLPRSQAVLLVSPLQEPRDSRVCLLFWFLMNGETPGTLNVYVEEETQEKSKAWSMSLGQGRTWSLGRFNIKTTHTWKLIFEAVGGGAAESHIAIDDVMFGHTECPKMGACDFEQDLCGWKNVLNPKHDTTDWDWNSGQAPSYFKGPHVDHTLGNAQGHYMFVDTEALSVDDTAWLLSEHFPLTKGSCLKFYYNINVAEQLMSAALKVFLYHTDQEFDIWDAKDSQSEEWRAVNITVESPAQFQVGFKAMKSDVAQIGYVAIDDVEYSPGVNCFGVRKDEVIGGAGRTPGIVAAVIIVLVVLGSLAVGAIYWRNYRSPSSPGTTSESSAPFGFDNLVYRNRNKETVTVEPLPSIGAEAQ